MSQKTEVKQIIKYIKVDRNKSCLKCAHRKMCSFLSALEQPDSDLYFLFEPSIFKSGLLEVAANHCSEFYHTNQ